jgi:hypothetical protein
MPATHFAATGAQVPAAEAAATRVAVAGR